MNDSPNLHTDFFVRLFRLVCPQRWRFSGFASAPYDANCSALSHVCSSIRCCPMQMHLMLHAVPVLWLWSGSNESAVPPTIWSLHQKLSWNGLGELLRSKVKFFLKHKIGCCSSGLVCSAPLYRWVIISNPHKKSRHVSAKTCGMWYYVPLLCIWIYSFG